MLDFLVKKNENLLNCMIFLLIFIAVRFLINAIGLFLITKKRYAKSPFMAFIPFLSPFALGAVADKANLKRGKETNSAKTLMLLSIFKTIAYIAFLVVTFFSFKEIIASAEAVVASGDTMTSDMFKSAIFVIATYLIAFVLAVIYAVYYYIALFKVYKREMNAAMAVLSLLLSLFVSPVKEIIIFILGIAIKEEIGFEIE